MSTANMEGDLATIAMSGRYPTPLRKYYVLSAIARPAGTGEVQYISSNN